MELWDVYDEKRQPLNHTRKRGEERKNGEYTVVVEVWTVNSKGEILITLRDSSKEMYPNKWENTGGAVLSGETSREGAVRELFEETGIKADAEELILLGTQKGQFFFYDIYLLKCDIRIEQLTMQKGETVSAKWVKLGILENMMQDNSLAEPCAIRFGLVRKEFDKYYNDISR